LRRFKENAENVRGRFVPSYCKKQEKRHRSFRATFYGRSISVHKINLVILRTDRVSRIFSPETLSLSKDDESSPLRPRFSRDIRARKGRGSGRYSSVTSTRGRKLKCEKQKRRNKILNMNKICETLGQNFVRSYSFS